MISFLIEENEGIRRFLEGDDDCIPVSEYTYLHDRPLLRPTFLTQIDDLSASVAKKVTNKNLKGNIIEKLEKMAIRLGKNMEPPLTEVKTKEILFALRDVYNLCKKLDKELK